MSLAQGAADAAGGISLPDLGLSYVILGGLVASFIQFPVALALLRCAGWGVQRGVSVGIWVRVGNIGSVRELW